MESRLSESHFIVRRLRLILDSGRDNNPSDMFSFNLWIKSCHKDLVYISGQNGLFEPSARMKERLVLQEEEEREEDTTCREKKPSSLSQLYPPNPSSSSKMDNNLVPREWKTSYYGTPKAWVNTSHRHEEPFEKQEKNLDQVSKPRVRRKLEAPRKYAALRQKEIDRMQDILNVRAQTATAAAKKKKNRNVVTTRVPVGNPLSRRSYRLGIDPIRSHDLPHGYALGFEPKPASSTSGGGARPRRPKTAGWFIGKNPSHGRRGSSSERATTPQHQVQVLMPKVAGALQRPQSARVSVRLQSTSITLALAPNATQVLEPREKMELEKTRRRHAFESVTRLVFRAMMMMDCTPAQVFHHCREAALLFTTLPRTLTTLERVSWGQYQVWMRRMNMDEDRSTREQDGTTTRTTIDLKEEEEEEENRERLLPLYISRSQFQHVMRLLFDHEMVSMKHINALYSVFDQEIEDQVEIGRICRAMDRHRLERQRLSFEQP